MTRRTLLRVLSFGPVLFAVFGLLIVVGTVYARKHWSPVPGVAVGLAIIVAAAMAVATLWRASPRASVAVLISGAVTLGALLALGYLFPIYNATDMPPSFLQRIWYPTFRAFIIVFTGGAAWAARVPHRERL